MQPSRITDLDSEETALKILSRIPVSAVAFTPVTHEFAGRCCWFATTTVLLLCIQFFPVSIRFASEFKIQASQTAIDGGHSHSHGFWLAIVEL